MSTNTFYESELEKAALEWFEELGYEVEFGPNLSPEGEYPERVSYEDVILSERLMEALERINPALPQEALEEAVRQVTIPQSPSLLMNNRAVQRMITDGVDVPVRREDGGAKTEKVYLFDFESPENNEWLAMNQFTVVEHGVEKRPDIVVFVNGVPLVVMELKSAVDEDVDISDGYNQLQTYKHVLPTLFTFNAFMVTSDGVNACAGTLTANEDRFMAWRTIEGDEAAAISIPQLEVLIRGMFEKERCLDIIRHFILFQSDGAQTIKILAGYHQYHAVNKAIESTERATHQKGDRRIGVIWHTQGSGKSLSMVFYAGKLVINEALENPTIVVITDRNDLDDQLYTTFQKSEELLRGSPVQATDREHLRQLLNQRTSGGIIFTTIHKFAPVRNAVEELSDLMVAEDEQVPVLTERRNVIVIADEAHRSQYGFDAEVVTGDDEARIKYGYAKYMRDSLPNASYIGFTGTPVALTDKNTRAVFGDYIDVYDMTRAVEDGTTVRIYYESRIAKLDLSDAMKTQVDSEYEAITEYQEMTQKERLKSKWATLEAIVGAKERIERVANDIINHFEQREH